MKTPFTGVLILLLASACVPVKAPETRGFGTYPDIYGPGQSLYLEVAWTVYDEREDGGPLGMPGIYTLDRECADRGGGFLNAFDPPEVTGSYRAEVVLPFFPGPCTITNTSPHDNSYSIKLEVSVEIQPPLPDTGVGQSPLYAAMGQIHWSTDGTLLTATSEDAVRAFDGSSLDQKGPALAGTSGFFSPDNLLMVFDAEGGPSGYDLTQGQWIYQAATAGGQVNAVAWAPDGKNVLISDQGDVMVSVPSSVVFVDAHTMRATAQLGGISTLFPYFNKLGAMAWAPAGNLIVLASTSTVVLIETSTWSISKEMFDHGIPEPVSVRFSSDGRYILEAGKGAAKFDAPNDHIVLILDEGHDHAQLAGGAWSADGLVAWLGTTEGDLERYDDGVFSWSAHVQPRAEPAAAPLSHLALSPDGSTLAAAWGGDLVLLDPDDGTVLATAP